MVRPIIDLPSHRAWLDAHSRDLLWFGRRFPAPDGGAGWLDAQGHRDPAQPMLTWITARMVHVYGVGALMGIPGARPLAEAALAGLTGPLRDRAQGGWVTSRNADGSADASKSAYAHSFVVLAASTAVAADLPEGSELLTEALETLGGRFFDAEYSMHVDAWSADWTTCDPYRGLNANMHAVEALLAAADVSDNSGPRTRALHITRRVIELAREHNWRIPEHFDETWTPQLNLNIDAPNDQFKPFGATVGHGLEWARLILQLDAALGADAPSQLRPAAIELYDRAVADGWEGGRSPGFVYTTDWSGAPVVRARLHWVAAEAIGAAAALFRATGEGRFAQEYARWWDVVATHFIDGEDGSWFHELDVDNLPATGVWSGKPDLYHAFQATLIPRLPLSPSLALAVRDDLLDSRA